MLCVVSLPVHESFQLPQRSSSSEWVEMSQVKNIKLPKFSLSLSSADPEKVIIRGGSCAVDPLGQVLLEPDFAGEESVHLLELDLSQIARAKFDLDVVGHYARPDIFCLTVNEERKEAVKVIGKPREKEEIDQM
jgi:hypothetical protein